MDALSSVVSAVANQTQETQAASVMALKTAMDVQAQVAVNLINALPQMQYSNPAHLGGSVDIKI